MHIITLWGMKMQRVTIKDVAEKTGFSVPTVSKALTNKNGAVSQKTREYIVKTAKDMGYKVNRVAQSLSRKEVIIGIAKPEGWPQFYGQIHKGIRSELEQLLNYNVSGIMVEYPSDASEEVLTEKLKSLEEQNVDAVIICSDVFHSYSAVADLRKKGILVAEVGNSVIPNSDVDVRVDSRLAGRLAGEYIGSIVLPDARAAVLIASKEMPDHIEKVDGFSEEFCKIPGRKVSVAETHDVYEEAYAITKQMLETEADLAGIYVATVNSEAVCRCISDLDRKDIKLLITDIHPELCAFVEDGTMSASIFQNTVLQGRLATQLLYNQIISNKKQPESRLVTPEIVLRSNYKNYIEKPFDDMAEKQTSTSA